MLRVPEGPQTVTILSVDPGTDNLGVSIMRLDAASFKIVSVEAFTLTGSKLVEDDCWTYHLHGARAGRIKALGDALGKIMDDEKPFLIGSESPFYSQSHPQAYAALIEVIEMVKRVTAAYDKWKSVWLIDPPSVKRAVGASGNAKKDEVKARVLVFPGLSYSGAIPLDMLDEHSIDAIGVGIGVRAQFMEANKCLLNLQG